MKALFSLKIYDKRIKNMMKVCRISFNQNQVPFMTKFIEKQNRNISLGNGEILTTLNSMFWVKYGNVFLKPRYEYDYEKEETTAIYNISEKVLYTVKEFDKIYNIILRNGKVEKLI